MTQLTRGFHQRQAHAGLCMARRRITLWSTVHSGCGGRFGYVPDAALVETIEFTTALSVTMQHFGGHMTSFVPRPIEENAEGGPSNDGAAACIWIGSMKRQPQIGWPRGWQRLHCRWTDRLIVEGGAWQRRQPCARPITPRFSPGASPACPRRT